MNKWSHLNDKLRCCTEKQAIKMLENEKMAKPSRSKNLLRIHQKINLLRAAREIGEMMALVRNLSGAAISETIQLRRQKGNIYGSVKDIAEYLGACDEREAIELIKIEMKRTHPRLMALRMIHSKINKLRALRERDELVEFSGGR